MGPGIAADRCTLRRAGDTMAGRLARHAGLLYNDAGRGGGSSMKRMWTVVLLLGLGVTLADCSRCNFPTWGPRACHEEAPKAGG